MDMRYHWLTDRVRQKQFDVYWRPGRENLGDYHTKHHSAQHHKDMRHLILHEANVNTSGKVGAQIPQPPPGRYFIPVGRQFSMYVTSHSLHG
jgi:hypothetical protein